MLTTNIFLYKIDTSECELIRGKMTSATVKTHLHGAKTGYECYRLVKTRNASALGAEWSGSKCFAVFGRRREIIKLENSTYDRPQNSFACVFTGMKTVLTFL